MLSAGAAPHAASSPPRLIESLQPRNTSTCRERLGAFLAVVARASREPGLAATFRVAVVCFGGWREGFSDCGARRSNRTQTNTLLATHHPRRSCRPCCRRRKPDLPLPTKAQHRRRPVPTIASPSRDVDRARGKRIVLVAPTRGELLAQLTCLGSARVCLWLVCSIALRFKCLHCRTDQGCPARLACHEMHDDYTPCAIIHSPALHLS